MKKPGVLLLLLCLTVLGAGCGKQEAVGLPNPLHTVSSTAELSQAIGGQFPEVPGKTVKLCQTTQVNGKVLKGEAIYTDGSSLAMGQDGENVSGVYGGKVLSSLTVEDVTVDLCRMEDLNYGEWITGGFSYCYYGAEGEDIAPVITRILSQEQ